eukprot:19169-Eustigmatos_ZCMA.PRE.1
MALPGALAATLSSNLLRVWVTDLHTSLVLLFSLNDQGQKYEAQRKGGKSTQASWSSHRGVSVLTHLHRD